MAEQSTEKVVGQTIIHEDLSNCLGSGGFGQVFKGKMDVAAKKIPFIQKIQKNELKVFHLGLTHPNIVRIFDIQYIGLDLWVIMEQCDCNWETYLKEDKPDDELKMGGIRQASNAMKFLHERKICHRDMKPENLLVKHRSNPGRSMVKLADFGLAKDLEDKSRMFSNCGTDKWKAPELYVEMARQIQYTIAVDVFSFGLVILYTFLSETDRKNFKHACKTPFHQYPNSNLRVVCW